MSKTHIIQVTALGLSLAVGAGCQDSGDLDTVGTLSQEITDVAHTPVERQSIGNCWLYAQATWVESMALSANPDEELDVSQSYWTYWHWFDEINDAWGPMDEISTGGNQYVANRIIRNRGFMHEVDFVPDDSLEEMSERQDLALYRMNEKLANGELKDATGAEIRDALDEAWELSDEVIAQLDQVFGEDGAGSLSYGGGDPTGTSIKRAEDLPVRYARRVNGVTEYTEEATLDDAMSSWDQRSFPYGDDDRRDFLRSVQLALHDQQPVIISWKVDFNALENEDNGRGGSFNLQTLQDAGRPGRQGGHMTVLEDYQAETQEFGLLEAGVTLDPLVDEDARKLAAALEDDTEITILRTKNSWGADRPDRMFAPGFPGYHDLWMDYLTAEIPFCPGENPTSNDDCLGETTPLAYVILPPGYAD